MPRFNGTGPLGLGPMTGRGLGPCARFVASNQSRRLATLSQEEKLELLKKEEQALQQEIKELEAQK